MGAMALYAGARLPRRWAWLVPVAAMVLSDLVLDLRRRTIDQRVVALGELCAPSRRHDPARSACQRSQGRRLAISGSLSGGVDALLPDEQLCGLGRGSDVSDDARRSGRRATTWDSPSSAERILADLVGTAILFGLGPVFERAVKRLSSTSLRRIRWTRSKSRSRRTRLELRTRSRSTPTPREPFELARLLVSVRSPVEAQAAVAGGAGIIDVKEPSRGSLGRADASRLASRASGRAALNSGERRPRRAQRMARSETATDSRVRLGRHRFLQARPRGRAGRLDRTLGSASPRPARSRG